MGLPCFKKSGGDGEFDDGIARGTPQLVPPFQLSATDLGNMNVPGKDEQNLANIAAAGGGVGICAKLLTDANNGITGDKADMAKRVEAFGENRFPDPPFESTFRARSARSAPPGAL